MKKLFNYIFVSILAVSSIIAIGHFTKPQKSQSISAEIKYQTLSSEDVILSDSYYGSGLDDRHELGTAYEEELVSESSVNKNLPCYAVVGLKQSAKDKIKANPYIKLPTMVKSSDEKLAGYIVGVSYYVAGDNVEDFEGFGNRGAFQVIEEIDSESNPICIYDTEINKIIKGVTIPSIYKYVSYCSFSNNTSVEEVCFEAYDKLTLLGAYAFQGTTNLKNVVTYSDKVVYKYSSLPIEIGTIGSYAFSRSGIESITLKDGINIDIGSFDSCTNLKEVKFEVSSTITVNEVEVEGTNITIGNNAFRNCYNLSSISLPYGLTSLGVACFENCYRLNLIEIPETVTSIAYNAFKLNNHVPASNEEESMNLSLYNSRSIILKGNHDKVSTAYPFNNNGNLNAPDFGSTTNKKYTILFIESTNESYLNLIKNTITSLDSTLTNNLVLSTKNTLKLFVKDPVSNTKIEYDATNSGASVVKTSYYPQEEITCLHTPVTEGLMVDETKPIDLTGYVFDGWYIDGSYEQKIENGFKANYGVLNLVALYKLQKFDFNIIDGSDTYTFNGVYGDTFKNVLTKNNLTLDTLRLCYLDFTGFYKDASNTTLIDYTQKITSDNTIYLGRKSLGELFDFTYNKSTDSYTISSLKQNVVSQVYIPKQYNGKNITKLDSSLFIGNTYINKVFFALDSEVVEIGTYAFQGCSNLTYFEIPAKCSDNFVEKHILDNTKNLKEIVILGSIECGSRANAPVLPDYDGAVKLSVASEDKYLGSYGAEYTSAYTMSVQIVTDPIGNVANENPLLNPENCGLKLITLFPGHFITLETLSKTGYHFNGYNIIIDGEAVSETVYGPDDTTITQKVVLESNDYTYSFLNNPKYIAYNDSTLGNVVYLRADYTSKFSVENVLDGSNQYSFTRITGWNTEYVENLKGDTTTADLPRYVVDANGYTRLVTQIGNNAFNGYGDFSKGMQKIIIPNSILYIDQEAFYGVKTLKIVEFEKESNLVSISFAAFSQSAIQNFVCDSTKLLTISEAVFYQCENLATFEIHSPLTEIAYTLFMDSGLTTFTLPSSVTKICDGAFRNTTKLSLFIIPDDTNLNYIGESAFENSAISSIALHKTTSALTIGGLAFGDTENLTSINLACDGMAGLILYDGIFSRSNVSNVTLPSNVTFVTNILSTFDGANNMSIIKIEEASTINITDHMVGETGHDNIVYSLSDDNMIIEYIPRLFNGDLVINEKILKLSNVDEIFEYLPNVKNIIAKNSENSEFYVVDDCIYLLDKTHSTATLAFVSNVKNVSRFVVPASIEIAKDKEYAVVNLEKYALNSNENIKILSFDKGFTPVDINGICALDIIYSNVVVVEISKNIEYMTKDNFINFKNLRTLRILNPAKDRQSGNLFAVKDTTIDKVFKVVPTILVPSSEQAIYSTLSGWEDVNVASKLTITFVTNGGAEIPSISLDFEETPAISNPTKTGYDFTGWYTDSALTNLYENGALLSDLTLYAGFKVHEYAYTYMVDDKVYYTQKVAYDTLPSGPETAPKKTGKVFDKWVTKDGDVYDLSKTKATSDMVLYASFKTDTKFVTKIIIIAAASLVVLIVIITIIVKVARKKRAKKDY